MLIGVCFCCVSRPNPFLVTMPCSAAAWGIGSVSKESENPSLIMSSSWLGDRSSPGSQLRHSALAVCKLFQGATCIGIICVPINGLLDGGLALGCVSITKYGLKKPMILRILPKDALLIYYLGSVLTREARLPLSSCKVLAK